jgi:hypothetical protein
MGPPAPPPLSMDEILARLAQMQQRAAEEEAERDHKPMHPDWFDANDYPMPRASDVVALANYDEQRHQKLITRIFEDLEVIGLKRVGVFRNFHKPTETPFYDPSVAADCQLMKGLVGGADTNYDALFSSMDERDEAQDKEDFLHFCDKKAANQHADAGNGVLPLDEADSEIIYGRVVARVVLNLNAGPSDSPFIEHLLDPATVFPTFEGERGLRTVTRKYKMRVSDVIGCFASKNKDVERKIAGPRDRRKRQLGDAIDVIEYWDRVWCGYIIDNEWVVPPIRHNYACVPFIYQLGALGRSPVFRMPTTASGILGLDQSTWPTEEDEIAAQGLSHIHLMKIPKAQREAILGRLMTEAAKSINPPVIIEMDDYAWNRGAPPISSAEGARNVIRMHHHKIGPFPTSPGPQILQPLMLSTAETMARTISPPSAYGTNDRSNVSGNAIESEKDSGLDKALPHIMTLTMFRRRKAELRLKLYRDWGWSIGTKGKKGYVVVPRQRPDRGQPPAFKMTHGMLRRTGIEIDVRLTSIRLQNLGPLGNAVQIWHSMGMMEAREGIELRGGKDPEAIVRRVRIERAMEEPEFARALLKADLRKEAQWDVLNLYEQELRKSGGPSGSGSSPLGPGGPPGGGGPGTMGGMSLPPMLQGPGRGSGPQGPVGPRAIEAYASMGGPPTEP